MTSTGFKFIGLTQPEIEPGPPHPVLTQLLGPALTQLPNQVLIQTLFSIHPASPSGVDINVSVMIHHDAVITGVGEGGGIVCVIVCRTPLSHRVTDCVSGKHISSSVPFGIIHTILWR